MSSELQTTAKGRIIPGKAPRGRPKHAGLILQTLPTGVIMGALLDMKAYKDMETHVMYFLRGELSEGQMGNRVMEALGRHVNRGGILEAYEVYGTTTTDLRKYRILEILHLPSTYGPLSLVPGFTAETRFSINKRTLAVSNASGKMHPNDVAKKHINPDRR